MSELKPCPFCGREVTGHLCGGEGKFGVGEWEYEIECGWCGLYFNTDTYDTPEKAETTVTYLWNKRVGPTTTRVGKYRLNLSQGLAICPNCGSKLI